MVFTNSNTGNKKIKNYAIELLVMENNICAKKCECVLEQHSNNFMPTNIEFICESEQLKINISQPQNTKYILNALLDIQFTGAII